MTSTIIKLTGFELVMVAMVKYLGTQAIEMGRRKAQTYTMGVGGVGGRAMEWVQREMYKEVGGEQRERESKWNGIEIREKRAHTRTQSGHNRKEKKRREESRTESFYFYDERLYSVHLFFTLISPLKQNNKQEILRTFVYISCRKIA